MAIFRDQQAIDAEGADGKPERLRRIAKGRQPKGPAMAWFTPALSRSFGLLALFAWAAFAVVPILWLLLAATKTQAQLSTDPPFAFGSWDTVGESWQNLLGFNNGVVLNWLWNTVVLTVPSVVLTVVATVPAGYALGACSFRLRKSLLMLSLVLMLMPMSVLALPLFLEMTGVGLIGNRLSVILPMSTFPFGVYLAFIYFSTTISRETYNAARLDGCNEWQVFRRIALPLSWPIVALVAFFSFMRNWNDFFLPFIMLGSDAYPLPVGLAQLAEVSKVLAPGANASSKIHSPELLLATIITMVPVMIAVIVAQRTILKGADMLGGGLRG